MIKEYLNLVGSQFLKRTLGPLVKELISKNVDLELDPKLVDKKEELLLKE